MNRGSKRHINAVNVTASINYLIQSITTCFDRSLGKERSICSFLVFDNEEMKHFTDLISSSMKAVDSFSAVNILSVNLERQLVVVLVYCNLLSEA